MNEDGDKCRIGFFYSLKYEAFQRQEETRSIS